MKKLGITYPHYLMLMVLWEIDSIAVTEIMRRLILKTHAITPILKRMEAKGIITRQWPVEDEREVIVTLTLKGKALQHDATSIPENLLVGLVSSDIKIEELQNLKDQLFMIIHYPSKNQAQSNTGEIWRYSKDTCTTTPYFKHLWQFAEDNTEHASLKRCDCHYGRLHGQFRHVDSATATSSNLEPGWRTSLGQV